MFFDRHLPFSDEMVDMSQSQPLEVMVWAIGDGYTIFETIERKENNRALFQPWHMSVKVDFIDALICIRRPLSKC